MSVATSTFTVGPPQQDGRCFVTEIHVTGEGREFKYEYLAAIDVDPQVVLEERARAINATLATRAASLAAVVGTDVPLTKYEYLSRFTTAERIAIREKAKTDLIVFDFMEMMNASGGVYLKLARPGLNYLASVGTITAERAQQIGTE